MKGKVAKAIGVGGAVAVALLLLAALRPALLANTGAAPSSTPAALLPVVVGGSEPVLTPPPGVPDLRITDLLYEGTDEQVLITNQGTTAQDMTGWRLYSAVGEQWYDFLPGYTLAAGVTVYLHSGPDAVDNLPLHLLWATAHMWNNLGDKAVLYDDKGRAVDSSCYLTGCP